MLTQRSTLYCVFLFVVIILGQRRSSTPESKVDTGVPCRPLCAWTTGWSDPRLLTYLETSEPRGKMTKYNTCARSGDPGFCVTVDKMEHSGSTGWEWAWGCRPNSDRVRHPLATLWKPAGLEEGHVNCSSWGRCVALSYCACAQNVCQLCRCI